MRAVARWSMAAALALALTAQAAEEPAGAVTQRRIVVMLQDFTHLGCGDCGGLFGGGLIGWEDRKRVAALGEQYAALVREIPGLDIESLARTSFCRELAGTESACLVIDWPMAAISNPLSPPN
ncbi:MAG TPA: hypothetical protein VFL16_14925 [Steroidobacteraceae bacterium]|nr:hypothetical protein [Steroidobacteraceae bacterium]